MWCPGGTFFGTFQSRRGGTPFSFDDLFIVVFALRRALEKSWLLLLFLLMMAVVVAADGGIQLLLSSRTLFCCCCHCCPLLTGYGYDRVLQ